MNGATKPAQFGQVSGGRGKRGGDSEAARKLGESRQNIQRVKKHVAIADAFPVLKRKEWKQSQALAAVGDSRGRRDVRWRGRLRCARNWAGARVCGPATFVGG